VRTEVLAALFGVSVAAGWIDAIAGGGGLLTLPALLLAGLPPTQALATNKLQGSFGAFSASLHFLRHGQIRLPTVLPGVLIAALAAGLGAQCVRYVDTGLLRRLIPILLILLAVYFLLRPGLAAASSRARVSLAGFFLLAVPAIAFYDGILGPGTGTFLALAGISLRGLSATGATAQAKWLNLGSNVGSLAVFLVARQVSWWPGLVMAAGQILGARLGAGLVMKRGAAIVRPLVILVSLAISARLLLWP
jgi:uncharacterized membrane protein YfcA